MAVFPLKQSSSGGKYVLSVGDAIEKSLHEPGGGTMGWCWRKEG